MSEMKFALVMSGLVVVYGLIAVFIVSRLEKK
jgi:hypothetical protein